MQGLPKKIISMSLAICVCISLVSCSFESAKETVITTAENAKDSIVCWYSNLDFSKFKDGWNYSAEFLSEQFSTIMSSEYLDNIEKAISELKKDMNAAAGSMRGTAQEAGYLAEKWAADTFNINAVASGSSESANAPKSNEFGSADVITTYGEEASLKYYQAASGSAIAQARSILEAYFEYCQKSNNPISLKEYLDNHGYDPGMEHDALFASVYEGMTRIIPSDQLQVAIQYLQGLIDELSVPESITEAEANLYKETLSQLRDRLRAPDGTESKPITYAQMQAIAEVSKNGEFKPEDFGVSLSTVISPKFVVKMAIGTGVEVAILNTVLTVGPDIYSILKEAAITGNLDEDALKEQGIEAVIAGTEGFVEGSICQIVTVLCQAGTFGPALQEVNPTVVAALTFLVIEAAIHGYELSQGKITAEEYGNMMVDRAMVTLLALPTIALLEAILPETKLAMMAGCMAGGMIAAIGYTIGKEAVLDIVDGGGFEAIIPTQVVTAASIATDTIASLNIQEKWSDFSDTVISTASDGYIMVTSLITGD